MKPIEIKTVDKMIEEMVAVAPEGSGPGYHSHICINNSNIWRIVKEIRKLQQDANDFRALMRAREEQIDSHYAPERTV